MNIVKKCIESWGLGVLLIDVGVMGNPAIPADVCAKEVAAAGGGDLATLQAKKDRGEAVAVMSRGAAALLPKLYAEGR